jgi:hypothetical protein
MHTVRTSDGTRYLLLKRSSDSSLVRDPMTGNEQHIENDRLERIDDDSVSPLETVARTVPDSVRQLLSVVSNERVLGLLLVIDRRGPIAVSDIMDLSDLCESDVNGLLTEFRAAGLIEQEQIPVVGVSGYETTELASEGLSALCDSDHTNPD